MVQIPSTRGGGELRKNGLVNQGEGMGIDDEIKGGFM